MYMSEDASAPVLTGQYGSLVELLTKVLVDGYGSKPSLGWTKEFEDIVNNVVVFRMPGGSRTLIRVDDNYTVHTGRTARIIGYESMSDVDIGIHPCPDPIETYSLCSKSSTTDGTVRGWRIIGNDKGFYFLPRVYGSADVNNDSNRELLYLITYYGDYINLSPDDPATYCAICTLTYLRSYLQSMAISSPSTGFWRMRDSDNEVGYTRIGLGSGYYGSDKFGNNTDLSPLGGKNLYTRSYVHKDYMILGSLPGLINWIGTYKTGSDTEIKEYYEYEDSEKVSFSFTSYSANFAAIVAPTQCMRFTIKLGSRFCDA